jgi:hypothetical protein
MSLKIEAGMVLHRTAQRILGGGEMVERLNIALNHHFIINESQGSCTGLVVGYPAVQEYLGIGDPVRIEAAFLTEEYFEIWTPPENILLYHCQSAQIDIGVARVVMGELCNLGDIKTKAITRAKEHFLLDPAGKLDRRQNIKCAMCALWYLILQ